MAAAGAEVNELLPACGTQVGRKWGGWRDPSLAWRRETSTDRSTESVRMDEDWGHMTEKILNLTLELIYLLTGEDYEIVKKTARKYIKHREGQHLSKGFSKHTPAMSLPSSLIPERNNKKKILEVTQKIIELLTGEVPIRCQDVSVYFSMEEWEYLGGHRDLYKDAVMGNHQTITSPDGSRKRNPPERCPRPLYSRDSMEEHQEIPQTRPLYSRDSTQGHHEIPQTRPLYSRDSTQEHHEIPQTRPLYSRDSTQEDGSPSPLYSQDSMQEDSSFSPLHSQDSTQEEHDIPKHFQLENLKNIKVEEIDEEEESLIRSYWQRKAEDGPIEIDADGHMKKMPKEHLLLSADVKDEEFSEDYLEELPDTPNTFGGLHGGSPDPSHPGEASPDNLDIMSLGQRGGKMFPCSVCGKWFTTYGGLLMHQRLHTGVKPFSCSFCGKSFTQKGILVNHEKIHRGIKPFPCSVCGKCFAKKSDVVRHLRVHTGEKPFPCARCGRCFSQKSSLLNHLRLYICEKPYPCFICGKRFAQRSELSRHQEMHRRKKTSPWSE